MNGIKHSEFNLLLISSCVKSGFVVYTTIYMPKRDNGFEDTLEMHRHEGVARRKSSTQRKVSQSYT